MYCCQPPQSRAFSTTSTSESAGLVCTQAPRAATDLCGLELSISNANGLVTFHLNPNIITIDLTLGSDDVEQIWHGNMGVSNLTAIGGEWKNTDLLLGYSGNDLRFSETERRCQWPSSGVIWNERMPWGNLEPRQNGGEWILSYSSWDSKGSSRTWAFSTLEIWRDV